MSADRRGARDPAPSGVRGDRAPPSGSPTSRRHTPEDRARAIREAEKALALADDHLDAADRRAGRSRGGSHRGALTGRVAPGRRPTRRSTPASSRRRWSGTCSPDSPRSERRAWADRSRCCSTTPWAALDQDQLVHVLDRLERMADTVQVIVVSDDPRASSWAVGAGLDRAAAVQPQPADCGSEPQRAAPGGTT